MRTHLLLLLFPLLAGCFPSVSAADQRHRDDDPLTRPVALKRYYRDEDGDGRGAGKPVFVRVGEPVDAGYVTTNDDCDDENPEIVEARAGLLRDCNGNAVAETDAPQVVCVGKPEVFIWEDEEGLHAALRYRDGDGRFWIDEETARRATDGSLLRESVPDCAER